MAFIPLTDEEKRILQNGGAGETEPPDESAGGLFGGINVSSVPEVASARDRLADLRTETVDAEADISAVMDPGLLNRGGAFTRMPAEEPPFQGAERLNLAPEGGTVVELSPEEKAVVAKEAPMAESTRFLAERFREAYNFGDPDAYAEDMKRASATGIPFHLVYNDNEMRQAADWQRSLERNLDGLSKLPPALVNWLRIPGRMELARDDIGTLAQLGELLRVEEYRKNTWNITQGYRGGTASMEMGDIGTKAIFGQATEADLKRMEELRESLALNDRTKGTTGDKLVSGLGYTVGLRQEQFRTMADKALLYGAYGAGLAGLFGQAGPQVALPEELITVPAGFMFGARYGVGLGALTKGFAMEAGNAYWEFKEIRDEEGNFLPEELIRVGAILYGIGSSGLEALQAGKLAKVVPGMGRLLTREGISTLLKTPTFRDAVMKFFKEYSGDLTFEVLTEGAQKGWQLVVGEFLKNEQNVRELGDALGVNSDDMYGWMQQAGGIVPDPEKLGFTGERGTFEPTTFAAAMDDVWKEVSEATYSFALGLVPGAGINFVSNSLAVSRAKDMQARFNTIAGLTQESRLAKRFPPAWREAIQTMVKDGPIAEVGIDANVFYDTLNQEGLNPTEVALQLGVKAEDLEEARKNKTDIWVETGAYAEHVAGTELHDRLHQDIRVGGPEELTLREATAREKELRGQFNDAVEEASRALEASGADRAQLEEIQANVREQLQSLGAKWLKPNVVEGYATLWAHMAQQAAKRWGITPMEWAERISLKIVDGEDGTKRLTASYDQQAGRFSATMDRDLLERAEQMWASGQDADAIWQATGWEMGTDGKWRYEISDADAAINTAWDLSGGTLGASIRDAADIRLDQILEHPKIFAAYPLLRRLRVEYKKSMTDAIAAYDHDNRRILIGPDFLNLSDADAVSTMVHEIQHGIQVTEMFAQGGSPEMIGARSVLLRQEMEAARQDPAYQDARRQYADLFRRGRRGEVDPQAARDFWAKAEETVESVAEEKRLREELGRLGLLQYGETERTRFDAYRRLYGEAEARAAEIRRLMTDGERAAESFQATLKKMLVAEGLAAEDQDLTDATLVVNPGTEYELSIPWRGADPVRHDADIADAVAAAIMDHEQGEANPDNILLPPDGQTLFQVQNLEEYGGTWEPQIRTWMEQNGFSEAQIHERLGAIRGQMAIFSALGPVQLELLPQGAGLNRGKGKGPIRKNSDLIYKITFDASAMCPKRLSAAATAFEVQKRIGRALTASERMALVALYKAAGKAAPCIYCYVEAPRGKSSEFVKVATDVVIGKTEPKKSWSKSSTDLAKLARTEYETLGMTPADIDPNVILDFEYAETAEARSKVEAAPAIYAFLLAQMLAAKANLPKLYEEYSGQILDLPDDLLKELNTYAGLRFFSSSDFQEAHIADLMQAFVDMSLRGATSHAYTKILEYVRIFGKTRQKIQTSIFAKEVNGQIVMDDWKGMDWAEAKKFRKEFPDVGTVLVGASDNIVAWALQQDWIDYIIPFHYSGLEKKYYSAMGWQDFTSTQREISIDDPKQGDHGIRMHETGSAAGITNAQGTRNYLKLALERRLYPVFPSFIFKDGMEPVLGKNGKPLKDQRKAQTDRAKARWKEMVDKGKIDWKQINLNYYKLRKDYARTDTPFLPVQAEFDMGEAQAAFERFLNGEAPGAKIETGIADDLVRLIREHGEGVGEWALTEVNMGRPLGPSSMGWQGAGERSAATTGMDILAQAISSANTSLRQVAATFKNKYFTPGDRNLDIGGGRFDYGTRFLGEKGVENLVFDPYNRSPEHNRAIIERLRGGERFPTVTVNNVLNVIAEQDVRENVVLQAAKSLEDGGTAYFLIHEGDGGGQGRKTSKGWQNNRKADLYTEEVGKHFSAVERKGNLILAKSPVNTEGPAAWDASPDTADRTFFQDSIDTDYLTAVEAGDMEAAQRMVDEAAKEAGYGIGPVVHGSFRNFNEFKRNRLGVNTFGNANYPDVAASSLLGHWFNSGEIIKSKTAPYSDYRSFYLKANEMLEFDDLDDLFGTLYPMVGDFDSDDYEGIEPEVTAYVKELVEDGYDGIKVNDDTEFGGISYVVFDSEQIKSADPIVKDDQGNVIPLSKRFDPDTPDIRYQMSTADTLDAEYLAAVEAGDLEAARQLVDEAAEEAGFTVQHVFHGSKRIDRLGNELKPERATSGPMPFFTDDPTIAENYSQNKADTSIEIPESYTGWFKVAVGRGKPKTIDQAWLYLSLDKRRELAAKLPHVVNTDENGEVADEFRLTDDEYGMTNKSHWDFVLREKRGNVLAAAVEIWLDSGELFDQEERFLEILRLAGLDGVVYDSPWLEQPGVLEAHLAIRTPLDTSSISDDDFAALEAASKGKRGSTNIADEWDKRRFSGKEWIALLEQDRKDGTSFAWTSIPDWVSRELHRMGYDGIKDQGGKYTGEGHTVWIPFFPWQVKQADGITRDDKGNVIPLSQRFDTGVKDMRYQTAYHGSPHRFADFSNEYIGAGEGAQAFGWGLYFADKKEVAEYYRTSVTNRQPTDILIDEASITSLKEKMPPAPFPSMIRAALNGADGDIDRAKEYLLGRKEGNPNLSPNRLKQYDDAINFVESLRGHEIRIERPGPGQIYEVDIPDDNVLLDWDKPLNEQPEAIRKALKTVEGINVKSWLKGNPTGKEVYNQLVSRAQDAGLTIGKNYADDRQAASEILNGVGIKGIRYLDALSRDGSGDSRNYVIWDDKAIAIQQTYYQKSAGGRQYPTQGFISRSNRGITITLTPRANRSTFLHELGHLFLWDLESLVGAGKADSRTAGDWEVVRSWWGGHARDLADWIAKHGNVPEDVRALFAAPDGAGIVRAALAGKEPDAVMADAVRVAAEEYWARGFEQYLFEGVAPSRALRQIFDNFKRWLAKVYRALKGAPDVELSDDVRAVMDRLLASEEEVDQAQSLRESERLRNRLIQQGIPTVEADALREAADEAAFEAKTKLLALLLKELGAETREMARKRREAVEPGIREAMRGESAAWKAYDDLLQFADTGYNLAPDERYGEANDRLTSPEGTVPMESAADLLGLDGVEELQALLAEEARNPFEAELNARLDAEVRDLENKASDRETMQTLAEEMLSGEARLRLLALEQAILARKIGDLQFGPEQMEDQPSAWETTAQQARQMSAQVRAYREVAEQLISDKRVRDARAASRYLAAARKAGREAYELALKGRYEESLAAKDREMMSTALYQASLAARDEMEKAEKHLKKYWGGRKRLRAVVGEEHFAQVMGLTERYGFNGEDELSGDRPHLGDWVAAANAQIGADPNNQGAELPVAKWLITDDYKDRKMSWKDLTVTEFRELVEAVEAIDYFGRSRNKLLAAEREADFAKAKADLEASVTAVHGTLKETPLDPDYRGAGAIGRYLASSDRAEHILRRLDGFKDMAVAWLTFFDPVVKAERAEMKRMREAKSRLETIFSVYSSAERGEMTKKKYTLQQLDPSTGKPLVLSKENVLALLLNWGARENREEVVFGYGFDRTVWNSGKGWIHYGSDEEYWAAFRMGSAEVEKLFSQVLEEKDYEVAQAVWDLNESYWPDIAAMSKKVTGVTPKKVKHLPVTSASGVTYRGGYMTLKFRPESNWDNFVVSEKESSKALYAPQGSRAHTKSGHTKERHQGERGKRLLRLDLGVETEHLRDALHDLYFRPVIRDLNKLLADPQVQKTIIGSIGMEAFKQFQPWVNGLANAYRTPSNYGEQVMQKVMGRTSAAILGWSLSSAAKQVFGWFPAVQVLGYKRTALAAFNFWRNPFQWGEMRDFAFEKSEYLRDRVRSFDRDVKAAMEAVTASPVRGKWSAVQETFFLFAGWMDMAVSLPVWTAAWDKGMLEFNGDEAKALEYADFVVRSTQNTGAAKDLAAIQQGSPAWKSMTMFYTAFGSMFQQTREQWFRGHGVRDIPRLAAFVLTMYVLPALLEDLMSGRGPEEDEPDDILRWALNSVLQYSSSQLILVRDVVNSASSGFSYRMSPMASAGTAAAKVMNDLLKSAEWALGGDEPDWEKIPGHLVEISGPAFGLPSNQIMRTMKAVGRYLDNDRDWSPWDFVITPPKKKGRR